MKPITRASLISSLRAEVPEFKVNPEWVDDQLGYPIVNDLARYICEQAGLQDFAQVNRGLSFMEKCLVEGDTYSRDLVLEGLETLLSCRNVAAIKSLFGPHVLDLWDKWFQENYEKRLRRGM